MNTTFIFLLFAAFLFFDTRKALVTLSVLCVLLSHFTSFAPLNLYESLSLLSVFVILFKQKNIVSVITHFPLLNVFIVYLISLIVTNLLGIGGLHITTLLSGISSVILLIVLWYILEKNRSLIQYAVYLMMTFGTLIIASAAVEVLTQSHFYVDYMSSKGLYGNRDLLIGERFGFIRCFTLFHMHTTSGCVASCLGLTLLYIKTQTQMLKGNKFSIPIIIGLIIVSVLSGSRADIMFSFIGLMIFFTQWRWLLNNLPIAIMGVLVIILFGSTMLSDIIRSFTEQDVGGSNTEMRLGQLSVSYKYFLESPWYGHGIGYTYKEIVLRGIRNIYGAESIWFQVMIDQGLLGIFSYLSIIVSSIIYAYKNNTRKVIWFLIGFFACNTLTSLPRFPFIHCLTFMFIMIAASKKDKIKRRISNS